MVIDETKMVESIDPEQRRVARSYAQFPFPLGHSNRSGNLNVQEAAAIRPVIMTAVSGREVGSMHAESNSHKIGRGRIERADP